MSSFMETIKKIGLILKGYTYNSASQYIKYKKMTGKISDFDKKILYSYPINGINTRIYDDFYSAKKFIEDKEKKFDTLHCIKTRYGYCLQNNEIVDNNFLIELIKEKGIIIRDTFNNLHTKFFVVEHKDGKYFVNGKVKTEADIIKVLDKTKVGRLVLEKTTTSDEIKILTGFEYPLLHVPVYRYCDEYVIDDVYFAEHLNENKIKLYSDRVKPVDRETDYVKDAIKIAENIASTYKGTEYVNVAFKVLDGELRIDHIDTGLDLLFYRNNREKEGDLFEKIQKKGFFKRIKDYAFSVIAKKKGFLDYMYAYWLRDLKSDFFHSDTPLRKKIWANRRGFYSYRIEQYGLTEENYKNYLSDYDYKRIRPLNLNYAKWLTDKITTYYMLVKDYGQFLAKHYYIILDYGNRNHIYSFEPGNSREYAVNDIIDLLKEKSILVVKAARGSHGEGFFKLQYEAEGNKFILNNQFKEEFEICEFINGLGHNTVVSEYVEMHDDLKKIYDKVSCTIRIMAINIPGDDKKVRHAYYRIATSKSGVTDNISGGGVVANVNMETGELENPETLANHAYHKCERHPDSGYEIKGPIPHWDMIKKYIGEIAESLWPLEYLGFDVVVTENGFKILEINTHQDLHKFYDYPTDVKEYLLENKERGKK